MHLEIVSPEATLFSGDVTSVTVPGVNGEFQVLDNHAPIVSLLQQGNVKIGGEVKHFVRNMLLKFIKSTEGKTALPISSGTMEMRDNKVIVLVD